MLVLLLPKGNETCRREKRSWLVSNFVPEFGIRVVNNLIMTGNKHEHGGTALIDDRPKVPKSESAPWQHIVFDQPFNQARQGILRLRGWNDPRLEELLEESRQRYLRHRKRELGGSALGRTNRRYSYR